MLKAIERERIPITAVAGTSIGGLVAAGWAAGLDAQALEEEARRMARLPRLVRLYTPTLPFAGLFSGRRVASYLRRFFASRRFEDLDLPLTLMATDFDTGTPVMLRDGSLLDAVRATVAVPGLLPPVSLDGRRLVDGILVDPLPTHALKDFDVDVVIAVDVLPAPTPRSAMGRRLRPAVFDTLLQTGIILFNKATEYRLEGAAADLLLRPGLADTFTPLAFNRPEVAIAAGDAAVMKVLPELRRLLAG